MVLTKWTRVLDTRKQQSIGEPQQTLKIRNMKGGRKREGKDCNEVKQTVNKFKSWNMGKIKYFFGKKLTQTAIDLPIRCSK